MISPGSPFVDQPTGGLQNQGEWDRFPLNLPQRTRQILFIAMALSISLLGVAIIWRIWTLPASSTRTATGTTEIPAAIGTRRLPAATGPSGIRLAAGTSGPPCCFSPPLSLDFTGLTQVSMTVDEGGKPVKYWGVPLYRVLVANIGDHRESAWFAEWVEVTGDDGSKSLIQAIQVLRDHAGKRYLLALTRNRRPVVGGKASLIVPYEPYLSVQAVAEVRVTVRSYSK